MDDPETSEALPWDVELEQKNFQNRYELGRYLVPLLEQCDQRKINFDQGLWTWLALFFFDQLCPEGPDGKRKPDANENYILNPDRRRQYRHAVRTTFLFVREYGEDVFFMFCSPAHKRGQITEDISARQYFLGCRGVIEAAGHLYYDPLRNSPKRGAAAKYRSGTVRRFGIVLKQFERTYDLFSLSRQQVLELLPREFDRFRVEEEMKEEEKKRPPSSFLGRIFRRRTSVTG
ncbi:MAG: hypothetical protein QME75_12305 [Deltaproteobacteria bacterium]|nr:hypothetical protein [Deltaproteobacteria bacterium]